jgi:hypothetical protein
MSTTTFTGSRLSFRAARLPDRTAAARVARNVARNGRALRVSLEAAGAYEAARTAKARSAALARFQAELSQ